MNYFAPNVVIMENDEERDRKTCISLDQHVSGANRELAQWLVDHPRYSAPAVAQWLGCGSTRIKLLREWAQREFEGAPGNSPARRKRTAERRHGDGAALKSQENLQEDAEHTTDDVATDVAPPEEILRNVLNTIERHKAVMGSYKKVLKVSALNQTARNEVSEALGTLITKIQSLQRALSAGR